MQYCVNELSCWNDAEGSREWIAKWCVLSTQAAAVIYATHVSQFCESQHVLYIYPSLYLSDITLYHWLYLAGSAPSPLSNWLTGSEKVALALAGTVSVGSQAHSALRVGGRIRVLNLTNGATLMMRNIWNC